MIEADYLKITYEDFQAILKEWEKYTFVLLKKLAKDMPTSFEMDSYYRQHVIAPFAEEINLSELTEVLWESLKSGANEVDTIHDNLFVCNQVNYFKSEFSSIEKLVNSIDYLREEFNSFKIDTPMDLFVKLGKPAQLQIIEEGFFNIAVSNFDKAEQIIKKKDYEAEQELIKIRDEKTKLNRIKKKVRQLDNLQCVFCGREYKYSSFDYFQINKNEFEINNVFLSCNGCIKLNNTRKLELKYGRFLNSYIMK